MGRLHDRKIPGESDGYREARDILLRSEIELRNQVEEVARLRRELPVGGRLKENYEFEELGRSGGAVKKVKFSHLFDPGKNALIVYSFMFGPEWERPCPMCTAVLDNYNGNAAHIRDRASLVVVAKAPVERVQQWANGREWNNLRMLSSGKNSYNVDYHAEWQSPMGDQHPLINVFVKRDGEIKHFWCSEAYFTQTDGQPRHVDQTWGLWNMLDLTPEGRGTDWYPKYDY